MKLAKTASILFISLLLTLPIFSQHRTVVKPPPNYVFIPIGELISDSIKVKVDAFFLAKYEVSNAEYRLFLNDLKAQGRFEEFKMAEIDSVKWRTTVAAYNEPFVYNYHEHKAYDNYPVVNISQQAAELYCKWLTEKYNLEQKKKGLPYGEFRLPNKLEWLWAAKGGVLDAIYPWHTPYLRNEKGEFHCRFRSIGDETIKYDSGNKHFEVVSSLPTNNQRINNSIYFPAPVDSYNPYGYGLFNMSGNVAEFTNQPGFVVGGSWNSTGYYVRIDIMSEYDGQVEPSPFIGFRPLFIYYPNKKN